MSEYALWKVSILPLFQILLGLKIFENRSEETFTTSGFSYWNDGKRCLENHEASGYHQQAVAALNKAHSKEKVDEALDKKLKQSKLDNHYLLCAVIDALKYLSRQGRIY